MPTEDSKISKAWNRKSMHGLEDVIVTGKISIVDLTESRRIRNCQNIMYKN